MTSGLINDLRQGIGGTLRKAASATGAGFDYLIKTATRESGMNPAAKARGSSAAGMFQFIEQTWLQTVKRAGPEYGLSEQADKITRNASGRYQIANPQDRKEILDLRYDPQVSATMAGAFTARNAELLEQHLGRAPTDGELYIAHFMGAQGAKNLFTLTQNQPDTKAAAYFPQAAAANKSIFYKNGIARSASEVYAQLVRKHDSTISGTTQLAAAMPTVPSSFLAQAHFSQPAASTQLAYASQPDSRSVFYSMFSGNRQAPVSSYVHQMWSGLNAQNSLLTSPNGQPRPPGPSQLPLNLFSFLNNDMASAKAISQAAEA
jgi:hypothetical protein